MEEQDRQPSSQDAQPSTISDPSLATRAFCGALLLPTISTFFGKLLYENVENPVHRTLLGGLTFIVVKGVFKIYLKQQQINRKKQRRIVDYTEENVRMYSRDVSGGAPNAPNGQPQPPQRPENVIV